MMTLRLLALLFLLLSVTASAAITVVYPKTGIENDPRQVYPIKLLTLALQQSGKDYQLQSSEKSLLQLRSLKSMELGRNIDVVWTETSAEREKRLRPIRIPIDKGGLGWRIFLIRSTDIDRFAAINSVQELQALRAGQVHDWPDVDVLWVNGLKVVTSSSYIGLFKMLAAGRIDYFPRSVGEVWLEQKFHAEKALAVDQNILLVYPTALYFFVNKDNHELAQDIEQGLETLIASGEFDRLFTLHYGEFLKRANVSERKVFKLVNPVLPDTMPLDRKELWLSLEPSAE